jgi:predicted GNAT superfamily acetyltransferase
MKIDDILDLDSRDTDAMLQLNNEHAEETSLLDLESLNALLHLAFFARGVNRGATALLIALKDSASYVNPNFMWFKANRKSFVYIDRVIVSHSARGQGIAKSLYHDLFAATKQAGFSLVVCEVNIDPPNPASETFHASMGFTRVGEATIHAGTKTVRYLEKFLA